MIPRERLVLLGLSSAAALTSFAGVLAVLDMAPPAERKPSPALVRAPAPAVRASLPRPTHASSSDRFTYGSAKDLHLPAPVDDLRSTVLPEARTAALTDPAQQLEPEPPAWSVETRTEATPPAEPPQRPNRFVRPGTRDAAPARNYSLSERLAEISPGAKARLAGRFHDAKAEWPPAEMVLVAIKDERILELHARPQGGAWKLIHRYPVLAASGVAGPKLIKGDRQVPEGIYAISFLNPNSRYHVSMRVNYPNSFDRQMAAQEGRKELGGDIMIHGKAASAGCLAMGDPTAEELFVLAAQVGLPHVKLIIAPTDFRKNGIPELAASQPRWLGKLYTEVASAMSEYKRPPSVGLLSFFSN